MADHCALVSLPRRRCLYDVPLSGARPDYLYHIHEIIVGVLHLPGVWYHDKSPCRECKGHSNILKLLLNLSWSDL